MAALLLEPVAALLLELVAALLLELAWQHCWCTSFKPWHNLSVNKLHKSKA
jgi:hypothetical protein